jgi:hypothetical protein
MGVTDGLLIETRKMVDLKFNHRAFFVNLNDTYNVGDYVFKVT